MINNTYSKAYTEVLEIIKYFPKEEYVKIPKEKIEFYKNNMDKYYVFTINPVIDLSEQNISQEANAIIVNLFRDYYATEEQKIKIEEILELNQKKEEQEKRKIYNPDNIFKKMNKDGNNTNTALIEYEDSFFKRFKNFIFKILHILKDLKTLYLRYYI